MEGLFAQAPVQHGQSGTRGVVAAHADACMIAMAMGDDGRGDGVPRIDVEITGRAVQAFPTQHDQIAG